MAAAGTILWPLGSAVKRPVPDVGVCALRLQRVKFYNRRCRPVSRPTVLCFLMSPFGCQFDFFFFFLDGEFYILKFLGWEMVDFSPGMFELGVYETA